MEVEEAVFRNIDKTGAIYMDDIVSATGYRKEKIGRWLRGNGFVKPCGGTSRRWINPAFSGAHDASRKVVEAMG